MVSAAPKPMVILFLNVIECTGQRIGPEGLGSEKRQAEHRALEGVCEFYQLAYLLTRG
jgi:hypothetical protein